MARSCISTARSGTVILAIALLCSACSTTWTPFQGAIWNPAQIFTESTDVRGLRVGVLYGKNASLDGLDVGLVTNVEGRTRGVQSGFVNFASEVDGLDIGFVTNVEGRVRGAQCGVANLAAEFDGLNFGGWNNVEKRVRGVQLAGIVNFAGEFDGLEVGLANQVEDRVRGVQLAGVANLAGEVAGVQLAGIYNMTESVVGAQLSGLVNHAEKLNGLQIGFLNFNGSGPLPFFPIFNFGFADESAESEKSSFQRT